MVSVYPVQAASTKVATIEEVSYAFLSSVRFELTVPQLGRFERHPYDRSTIRSIYHTREYDIARLSQLAVVSAYPTVFLSHDWPLEIEQYGDTAALIRRKPFFRDEVGYLPGSPVGQLTLTYT